MLENPKFFSIDSLLIRINFVAGFWRAQAFMTLAASSTPANSKLDALSSKNSSTRQW